MNNISPNFKVNTAINVTNIDTANTKKLTFMYRGISAPFVTTFLGITIVKT